MRDAIAGNAPGRPRHGLLPQVSALIRPHWPVLSRRLLITAGVFFAAFVVVALFAVALFRGLRLLAVLPVAFILAGSALEIIGKQVIVSPAPGMAFQRFPDFLPSLGHKIGH